MEDGAVDLERLVRGYGLQPEAAAEVVEAALHRLGKVPGQLQIDNSSAATHQMVQLDDSHHDWFEGRGPRCVLMVTADDATNRMRARFFAEETTQASYDVLEGWVRKHRLPASLYVDRDSIYRCEGEPSIAQQLAGKQPQTQFGRAMEQLGVELILANSPQAKGRVTVLAPCIRHPT